MKKSSTSKWRAMLTSLDMHFSDYDITLHTSQEAYAFLQEKWLRHLPIYAVQYHAIFLSEDEDVIGHSVLAFGNDVEDLLSMQDLLVMTCYGNAAAVIIAHDHVNGRISPCSYDSMLNFKLQVGLGMMDSCLRDHLLICDDGYYSFDDSGLIHS